MKIYYIVPFFLASSASASNYRSSLLSSNVMKSEIFKAAVEAPKVSLVLRGKISVLVSLVQLLLHFMEVWVVSIKKLTA